MKIYSHVLLFILIICGFTVSFSYTFEKPLVVVITSYKNKEWYQRNLDSVFFQKYRNYRVIYIDDASPDGTGELVASYVKKKGQQHRVKLIRNKEWQSQMANHYKAAHMCYDYEIVVHIDGDDWLAHDRVFKIINDAYTGSNIWLTHGGAVYWPGLTPWPGERALPGFIEGMIAHNTFRDTGEEGWIFCHLRTFYGWLFKQVKLQDLLYEGTFKNMSPTPDSGFMYPLLEMAGHHIKYLTDVLYMWNMQNSNSQWRITSFSIMHSLSGTIRSWQKYSPLKHPIESNWRKHSKSRADVIILLDNWSPSLAKLLASCSLIKGCAKLSVIYEARLPLRSYVQEMKKKFPNVKFLSWQTQGDNTIEKQILKCLGDSSSEHVVLCSDKIRIKDELNITYCIQELERTFAEAFYLSLPYNEHLICAPLSDHLIAWQIDYGKHIWKHVEHIGMILYRKRDLENRLTTQASSSLRNFKASWYRHEYHKRAIGLIFKHSRVLEQ